MNFVCEFVEMGDCGRCIVICCVRDMNGETVQLCVDVIKMFTSITPINYTEIRILLEFGFIIIIY